MQQPMEVTYAEVETADHGVAALSWAAIFGGALAAAGVSLILLTLGAGLGFSSLSAWGMGPSAATFGLSAAIWLIVVQWLSSAFGGYLAGRTRARWNGLHTDESTFRDTAHGVLSWALATVIAIGLVTAGAAGIIGGGVRAAATIGAGGVPGLAQAAGPGGDPIGLFTDRLFRADQPVTIAPEPRGEGGRILMAEMRDGSLSDADKAYLAQLVANATTMSPADAARRVDEVTQQVADAQVKLREAAEAARKAAARAAFFTAFSLLIGAFIAGAAGALGGVHREHHSRLLHRTI
jgi:hypothetical protein